MMRNRFAYWPRKCWLTVDINANFAKDGHEAICPLSTGYRQKRTPFSAVILDLTVPGSLGGKDTILRLREIDPHVIAFRL